MTERTQDIGDGGVLARLKSLLTPGAATQNPESSDEPQAVTLFPAESGRYGDGQNLPSLLKDSARRNTLRGDELASMAISLRRNLVDRAATDVTQIAAFIRFMVAAGWLVLGAYFFRTHTSAQIAGETTTPGGMPIADAIKVSNTFTQLGSVAIALALLVMIVVAFRNNSLKESIRSKSENFGLRVSQMLKEYDSRLRHYRDALGDQSRSNESVASEVSEAHVTAQEAMLLFEDIPFLVDARAAETSDQMRQAVNAYRGYLASSGPAIMRSNLEDISLGVTFGWLIGAAMGSQFMLELLGASTVDVLGKLNLQLINGFEQYPTLLAILIGGTILFLVAGVFASSLSAMLFAGERYDRARDSLNEIRGAVTGEEAPRAADIAQRVEDLSEIFRVRLMGKSGGNAISATAPGGRRLAQSEEDEIPHWRRPKEGPRFVETGFQATPSSWRTDAYAQYAAKNSAPEPGAKRRLLGFKKPDPR